MKLPPPLNWLWKAWMAFSHVLGRIMSFLILTVLWIVGFGIYGIIGKIIRLFAKKKETPASFWIDVPPLGPEHLKRQF
jgi:hypothetical protein